MSKRSGVAAKVPLQPLDQHDRLELLLRGYPAGLVGLHSFPAKPRQTLPHLKAFKTSTLLFDFASIGQLYHFLQTRFPLLHHGLAAL